MKIVLDANVIIAAFAARGLCESIMEVCLSEHEIVLGDELFDEILRNLRHKIKLPPGTIENIGTLLREHSTISIPVPLASDVCRDPDDVKVLGLTIGISNTGRLLVVCHTFQKNDKNNVAIRIFSGRKAIKKEIKQYKD